MPSSTSSSERQPAGWPSLRRASVALLAGVLLLLVGVEVGTRAFIYDLSNLLGRIRRESLAASRLQAAEAGPRPILIVGNSLLVAGVDIAALQGALGPGQRISRFAIEQTVYHDWYFGFRRLMGEGSRPSTVVVALEARHLLGESVRDEIFAHYLMQLRDIFSVARAVDLSPTATSELFFANISDFGGLRKEIRKNLLGRLMPALPSLTALMTRGIPAPPPDPAALATVGAERLKAFKSVGDIHGVGFALALMPPLTPANAELMRQIGEDNRVIVLTPLTDLDVRDGDYDLDGYHLSEQGRAKYTTALGDELRRVLPR